MEKAECITFESGAIREKKSNKGRYDLLPLEETNDYLFSYAPQQYIIPGDGEIKTGLLLCALDSIRIAQADLTVKNLHSVLDAVTASLWYKHHEEHISCDAHRTLRARCLLIDLYALRLEEGAANYGDRNWELGIPVTSYLDSAIRHIHQILGHNGTISENHYGAVAFNIFGIIFAIHNYPEMVDNYNDAIKNTT